MAIIQDFTIFQDDDATPLIGTVDGGGNVTQASFSTDPTHPRPYMKAVTQNVVNSEVKFKDGTSVMGGCTVEIVDVPTMPGDQTTGAVTAILASASTGDTQLLMRRAVLRQKDPTGVMRVIFDGVILDPALDSDTFVTYQFGLRSITERGRKEPVFMHALNASIVPPGAVNGYGLIAGTATQIVKPAGWEHGIFRMDPNSPRGGIYSGRIDFHDPTRYSTQWWSDWTDKHSADLLAAGAPNPVYDPVTAGYIETRFPLVNVSWRATGTTSAFKVVSAMPQPTGMQFDTSNVFTILDRGLIGASVKGHGNALSYITITSRTLSDLPTNNQNVDVRVLSNDAPTDTVPLMIECSFGQLLKDIYDGVYAFDPSTAPKVRYEPTAMAAFVASTPQARAIITQSEDDLLAWTAENIYKPLGYAPAENENGQIVPISFFLPDVTATLLTLNDANVVSCDWSHPKDEAVTSTLFTYQRDYVTPPDASAPTEADLANGRGFDMSNDFERLTTQEIQVRRVNVGSSTLFGDAPITYAPLTCRAVTTNIQGLTVTGDVSDEIGAKLAQKIGFYVSDRFSQGAQKCTAVALASDSGVSAAKVGDWVVLAASWIPDYVSQKRGANRLMQITQVQTPDGASRQFALLDAGPHGAPIGQPTIATPTQSGGIVSVAVSAIPTGAAAIIEYAISTTQPGATSPLWTFAARLTANGAVSTPPIPNGVTVWMRATGVAPGRRTSAPTNPKSVTIPILPVVSDGHVILNSDGSVTVNWIQGANAAAVRMAYGLTYDTTTIPSLSTTVDADASLDTLKLPSLILAPNQLIFLTITPYSGWSGSAATGTQGVALGVLSSGNLPGSTSPDLSAVATNNGDGTYTITWSGPAGTVVSLDNGSAAAPSASPFTVTQDLYDHQYVFSVTSNGVTVNENVLIPAVFKVGPELNYAIDNSGNISVGIVARRGTDRTFIAIRTDRKPTLAEILAGQELGPAIGNGNLTWTSAILPGTVAQVAVGGHFWIGAISETSGGQQSDPAYLDGQWLGVGVTPVPAVALGTPVATSKLVTIPIMMSGTAIRTRFFVSQSHTSLGGINVEGLVPEEADYIERNPDGTYQSSIGFLCTRPGDTMNITAIPEDILGQRGLAQNIAVVTPGSTTTPPGAVSLSAVGSITSTGGSTTVTLPGTGTTISKLAIALDGTPYATITAPSMGGTTPATVAGLVPGTSHTISVTPLASDGTPGPTTTTAAFTTTTGGGTPPGGTLNAPTSLSTTWSTVDQAMLISFSQGAGNPSNTQYHVLRSTSSGGTYTDIGSYGPGSPVLSPENQSPVHTQTVYYKLEAVDPTGAYASSAPTAYVSGVVPIGKS